MGGVWLAVRGVLGAFWALAAGVVKVLAEVVVVVAGWAGMAVLLALRLSLRALQWGLRVLRFGVERAFVFGKELLRRDGWLRGTALRDKVRGLSSGGAAVRKAKRMLAFGAGLVFVFWLGTVYYSPWQTPPDIESLDNKVRELAMAQIAHSVENEQLRAQLALRDAEVARLTAENRDLVGDILRRDETILTYRQIIDATGGDMVIHALAEDPGFSPGRRRLSAVLVRAKSGKFKGAYYFEVVGVHNGVESALRAPPKAAKLEFQRYREITESIELPDDARIKKMRLIVTDAKNKVIAIDELLFDNGGEIDNGNKNNNGENNEKNDDEKTANGVE